MESRDNSKSALPLEVCIFYLLFGLCSPELTYGIKGSTAGGSVSIAVMSEQLTPQLAV